MKYYITKKRDQRKVDYTGKGFSKCWTCQNACGGCSWSREFVPVSGWEAKPTYNAANREYAQSFHVYDCPEYIPDRRY